MTEVTVREHNPNTGDHGKSVWIDLTDDTDGPVTRVTKLVSKAEASDGYAVGKRFRLTPVEGD